ncbi:MAG TPA: hypothetical protein VEA40_26955 [Ramlibacter sp.]|nr:hypothetical protein [Ramlibacter sp.]
MTALLTELKARARIRLNAARRGDSAGADDLRLRDVLHEVSREVGFQHWEHARRVLGGLAQTGEDTGTFWHAPRTGILLNEWFARPEQAFAALQRQPRAYLLPYRRQFMVVQADFVQELGVDPLDGSWAQVGNDLVRGYATPAWLKLAAQRIRAPRSTFA